MAKIYAEFIRKDKKTLTCVPEHLKNAVLSILQSEVKK